MNTGLTRDKRALVETSLTGVFAVAWMLFGTRWGSYVGAPGRVVFLTDVLVIAGVMHLTAGAVMRSRFEPLRGPRVGVLPALLLAYVLARLVLGSDFSATAIRDAAPFAYVGLAIVAGFGYRNSSPRARMTAHRLLVIALVAHLSWCAAVIITGVESGAAGGSGAVAPLTLRPDIDSAYLGVLAGYAAWCYFRGSWSALAAVAVAGLAVFCVLQLHSRAGLLSSLICISVGAALGTCGVLRSNKVASLLVFAPFGVGLLLAVLPQTEPGARLLATVGLGSMESDDAINALGTADARREVWSKVFDHVNDSTSQFLFGLGFGPDFLRESGSLSALEGTVYTGVRSPHNFVVGSFARIGLVGTALLISLLALVLWRCWCRRQELADSPLLVICALVVIGVLPVSVFGVVFEAPFGYVPLFWCAGTLLAATWSRAEPLAEDPLVSLHEELRAGGR